MGSRVPQSSAVALFKLQLQTPSQQLNSWGKKKKEFTCQQPAEGGSIG